MSIRDVNPEFFDRICAEKGTYSYGDPMRAPGYPITAESGAWEGFSEAIARVTQRFQSFSDMLSEAGIDIYDESHETTDDELADALGGQRDDLWGFALDDRVMVTTPGAHYGLMGKVTWIGGCSVAKFSATCRRICPNVGFMATHRYLGDGKLPEPVTPGVITCPPNDLEHCD